MCISATRLARKPASRGATKHDRFGLPPQTPGLCAFRAKRPGARELGGNAGAVKGMAMG